MRSTSSTRPDIQDHVHAAAAARNPALRKAGNTLLAKLNPETALAALEKALDNPATPIPEKQNAFGLIAGIKSDKAAAVLKTWLEKILAGTAPAELELDIVENAKKSADAGVADLVAKYLASIPHLEHKSIQVSDFKAALQGGNAEEGRRLFFEGATAQCVRCHKVNGQGGDVGPELKEIGKRETRAYLLESIVDPSAKIAKGFETVAVKLNDGRVVTGILKAETETKLTLMPPDGKSVQILKSDIKLRKNQEESTMPQLTASLSKFDIRNLVEYLSSLK